MNKHITNIAKIALIIIVSIFSIEVKAQELIYKDSKVEYEYILNDTTINKEEFYKYSKRWTANSFKDSRYVLRNDDEKNGEIIGVALTTFRGEKAKNWMIPSIMVEFTFMISVKDGKGRLRFYDINQLSTDSFSEDGYKRTPIELVDSKNRKKTGKSLNNWKEMISVLNSGFKDILHDYKTSILQSHSDDF